MHSGFRPSGLLIIIITILMSCERLFRILIFWIFFSPSCILIRTKLNHHLRTDFIVEKSWFLSIYIFFFFSFVRAAHSNLLRSPSYQLPPQQPLSFAVGRSNQQFGSNQKDLWNIGWLLALLSLHPFTFFLPPRRFKPLFNHRIGNIFIWIHLDIPVPHPCGFFL